MFSPSHPYITSFSLSSSLPSFLLSSLYVPSCLLSVSSLSLFSPSLLSLVSPSLLSLLPPSLLLSPTTISPLQPRHAVKLLSVLNQMPQRHGPDTFFNFPGRSAAVRLYTLGWASLVMWTFPLILHKKVCFVCVIRWIKLYINCTYQSLFYNTRNQLFGIVIDYLPSAYPFLFWLVRCSLIVVSEQEAVELMHGCRYGQFIIKGTFLCPGVADACQILQRLDRYFTYQLTTLSHKTINPRWRSSQTSLSLVLSSPMCISFYIFFFAYLFYIFLNLNFKIVSCNPPHPMGCGSVFSKVFLFTSEPESPNRSEPAH